MSANVIGVDMGGTKILSAVIDPEGNILATAKVPTKADRGPSIVIDRIADSIRKAIDKAGVAATSIQAVGIGAPGPLDPATGVVIFAPNLRWKDVRLKDELEARVNFPTFVDNDVNVGTLGEHVFGAGEGFQNVVGIFVGTGIGGGIILQGELFHGASKTAGEIGHIIVKAGGPPVRMRNAGLLGSTRESHGDDKAIPESDSQEREEKCDFRAHRRRSECYSEWCSGESDPFKR